MFFRVAESEDDSRFRGIEKCLQNYKIYHGQANLGIESNIRGAVKRYIYIVAKTRIICALLNVGTCLWHVGSHTMQLHKYFML